MTDAPEPLQAAPAQTGNPETSAKCRALLYRPLRNLCRTPEIRADAPGHPFCAPARHRFAGGLAWIDEIVDDLVTRKLVDDTAFAETRAVSLHRGGASRRKIAMALRAKGVGTADIDAALHALDETHNDAEFTAACNYARRRRFGPWRDADTRAERRDRDLAAMARAGFGFQMAQRVIDAPDIDTLERDRLGYED